MTSVVEVEASAAAVLQVTTVGAMIVGAVTVEIVEAVTTRAIAMSEHYDAWSAALHDALELALVNYKVEQAASALASALLTMIQLFYDDFGKNQYIEFYYGDETASSSMTTCDCPICRPVGGRTRYDC